MENTKNSGESCSLTDFAIKRGRVNSGSEYELIGCRKSSVVASSNKKFEATIKKLELSNLEKLSDIQDVAVYVGSKVNLKGKVSSTEEAKSITSSDGGRKSEMQYCVISDSSGSCKIVLCEELINKLEYKKCYRFTDVAVKAYDGKYYDENVNSRRSLCI